MNDDPTRRQSLDGFVARLTAMTASDDAHQTYEEWAPSYESDLIEGYGYNAHAISADALRACCDDRRSLIVDMGCGTGLVAQTLAAHGYHCIDGADASPRMLEEAARKAVYRNLIQGDLTSPGTLQEGHYDAAIAVGVFGGGHIGPEHLGCFIHPVKEGGWIVLFANGIPFKQDNYRMHIEELERRALWKVEHMNTVNYMQKIDRPGWLVVARRCGGR